MKIFKETICVKSNGLHPTFHNITSSVENMVLNSGVKDGLCVVYSHHTTCSVIIEEYSHDTTYYGMEYLQQDLCNIMEKLIPSCRHENQYMHPGPKHIEFAMGLGTEPGEWVCLNTDAHLRSSLFGRSETIIITDGKLDLGNVGSIYFIDWDQVRERQRMIQIQIIGE